ncbi:nucleotidyltransferase family protein [Calidifontibacillus erzurumensis]|uniref:Nucleotidyltransferase family protein n=1 Tax=Calidifontibacillus erzurumensis TaxID=2741433 RepID=A0A8J8GFV9_9BACI|nr:nucleotidyltransferase family protein [Calidifontibacillus erzurumensis]NSL51028.1 nucleotidyltransferase family protein [Calidifontibacillus erzurumensis]
MKGVIIAGGKGSRLRPLTNHLPKPLVPILNKPVMEYAIEHLKEHGITEIAVTVQYLSRKIIDYFGDGRKFGVRLTYFEERKPLGTAGSVKNAEKFLDEPFIVMYGDVISNFDLTKGIQFHKKKKSKITIFMTMVQNPMDYGIINTDENGKVTRFLEKPSRSEVFSNQVNTGIYIMEPVILRYINKGCPFDFSLDLFPLLLKKGISIFGFNAVGYWSDVGNMAKYEKTIHDLIDGSIKVSG